MSPRRQQLRIQPLWTTSSSFIAEEGGVLVLVVVLVMMVAALVAAICALAAPLAFSILHFHLLPASILQWKRHMKANM
jgi:hypothetical protein